MGVIQLTSTTTPSHDVSHLLTAVSILPGQRTVPLLAASIVCSAILQRLHCALNTTLLALVPGLGLDLASLQLLLSAMPSFCSCP
jgi:hypothetical protein